MASLDRRVCRLEARHGVGPGDREQEARREVLGRMTDEELGLYEGVLERFEATGELGDADLPILRRVEELADEHRERQRKEQHR